MPGAGPGRIAALDRLRGFVIVLVVLHHSVLAYCTFGRVDRLHYALSTAPIVDAVRWGGFDAVVQLQDGFFMPLLFLLSGLFVPHGIVRAGAWGFVRGRLLRLGLPFVAAELTVVPLAYYPSFLQAGGAAGFGAFWVGTVTGGPWPSGPPWFVGVLLVFDAVAALGFRRRWWGRPGGAGFRPAWFGLLVVGSLLAYLPLLGLVGPSRWFAAGPVAVQASRVLLYAWYFGVGVWVGAAGMPGVVRCCEAVARGWIGWGVLALACAGLFLWVRGMPGLVSGAVLVVHCAAVCLAALASFVRFGGGRSRVWDSLGACGFAIYLVHYPVVTWTQYFLLPVAAGAVAKGGMTFVTAMVVSWGLAWTFRNIPVLGRVR